MQGKILHRGPWQVPYKAIDVLCSDGVCRTARLTREPDTFFSIPGSVKVRGVTVTGFVWTDDDKDGNKVLRFSVDLWRKNAHMLPGG